MITQIKLNKFTGFEKIKIDFSPGINVFIGENGTGKTNILKTVYAACAASNDEISFSEKLNRVFYPTGKLMGRLVKRSSVSSKGFVEVCRSREDLLDDTLNLKLSFSNHIKTPDKAEVTGAKNWTKHPIEAVYIPVKDMLANAPGFSALYKKREIHFEDIYVDILDKAQLPALKGPAEKNRKALLDSLQTCIDGRVIIKNEEFFLKNKQGELEFTLLAEGLRKLGLLSVLIQNGTLTKGSALFWDEPEANLNPKMLKTVVEIMLKLQRMGVQIFIATHSDILAQCLDICKHVEDKILFHVLAKSENGEIEANCSEHFDCIEPNSLTQARLDLYDAEIAKAMGGTNG